MRIDVTKEIKISQITVKMDHNVQGFDDNFPLGFMSPGGFIRFQVTEKSNNGTPRYSFPRENCSYSISLFGKEYNNGKTWMTDYRDWIPLNSPKELLMALQIQKDKREKMDRLQTKLPNVREILNQFVSPAQLNVLSPNIIGAIVDALEKSADEAIKLNK